MDTPELRDTAVTPALPPLRPVMPAVSEIRESTSDTPAELKVLCVDDCEDDVILIVEALREGGFVPDYVRVWTPQELRGALTARAWDIVVSDYSMPQMNGLEALEFVRAHSPDLPFLLVSGVVSQETAVKAMKSGAGDYIMKDDLTRLAPAVRRELAEAGGRRARRLAESNLRASETLLNSIVNTAADGIVVIGESGLLEFVNAAIESMFGWKPLELIGRNYECLLMPRPQGYQRLLGGTGAGEQAQEVGVGREVKAQRKDGSVFPLEVTLGRMMIDGHLKYACIMRDVTERKCAEERIHQLAHYDKLTGLPNRALFSQLLEQALIEAKYAKKQAAVLFIDLDRFKLINDSLSHDSGDAVLKQVARRLTDAQSRRNTVARFSGDEFVVLMRDCQIPTDAAETAQRLLAAIAQPFQLEGQEYHLTASIGISAYPGDGQTAQTILKNADIAMYRAKEHGKNNYQFYSAQMNLHSFERLVLERFLRHALEQDEFRVYYQPKVDLISGRVTGMEALLRWIHPAMGTISPTKFIPLAEETGLIVPIGAWVLKAACAQTRAWLDEGLPPLRVAVNLSARQFAQDDLHATVVNVLEETGLAPELLELEITESVTMENPEHAAALLRKLKALGIGLSIDDFGTGYSSLSYLKRFPIDNVKVDRSFIKDIPHDADDVAITQAVIAMSHSLGLKVIAEGVESEEHLTFLRAHGCEQAQGYLFGAPMASADFARLIAGSAGGSLARAAAPVE